MTVHAIKPTFSTRDGYQSWKRTWSAIYRRVSTRLRDQKLAAKDRQRQGDASKAQAELVLAQRDATKLMTLLSEAKALRDRLIETARSIQEMQDSYPLSFDTRVVDLHFNKGHIANPAIPMWVVKAKGRSYYVNHIDAQIPWTTRELTSGSTLGMIRMRNCVVDIDQNAVATIRSSRL